VSITTSTIIVADDEPLVQQTVSRLLESAGYTVVLTENGEELVRTALADPPTLILVDMHMPIMDGPEAVRQLRADHRTVNVPIVMMSAHPDAVALALDAGADGFLYKPFTIDEILHSIAHHIQRSHNRQ
jgi:DNA-binding response OmpR family regulator